MDSDELRSHAIALYDQFTHSTLDRRGFFAQLIQLAGSTAAAQALALSIAANPAAAAIITPEDERIKTQWLTLPGANGNRLKGYFVLPSGPATRRPAILVVHENRGLNGYIEDVARRLAVAGFAALAVDFLSPVGGTPADQDKARAMIGALDLPAAIADAKASVTWLGEDKRTNGKVGVVGFCWGGAMVNHVAVAAGTALKAGVAFYGPAPPPAEAAAVKAPMMLHYAGTDERVNAGAAAWVDALEKAGVSVTRHDYPDTQHAFHNDTSAARYNQAAAELAWERTIAFFRKELT